MVAYFGGNYLILTTMFRTKFKKAMIAYQGDFIVLYKKWYQREWHTLAVNNDPYKFSNKDAAEYMIKCLEM